MNSRIKPGLTALAVLGGLAAGSAQAVVTLNVAAAGLQSGITPVVLPLTATRTEGAARLKCGNTQDTLSDRVVLGNGRWELVSPASVALTAGRAVRGQISVQSAAGGSHDQDTLDVGLYCQMQNNAGNPASEMVPVHLHIHAVASPSVRLSTPSLDLGTCSPNRHEVLRGQFAVTTGITGDYPVSTETLRASVSGGGDTAGTVSVRDENDTDITAWAVDIRQTANGQHQMALAIPCPSEPGRYEWHVVITHDIE